jgi:ribonuclease T2
LNLFAFPGLGAALLLATGVAKADQAGDFDFYVLSLSWSPTFYASEDADPDQCDLAPPGFVVHGLWPQYESGYPEYCETSKSPGVDRSILSTIHDVMPDPGLATYQWRKHGSCSGLSQRDYFALMLAAYERVVIPAELVAPTSDGRIAPRKVEEAFVEANPGLPPNGIAVRCGDNRLNEVRICLDKQLRFRSCLEVDRSSCRAASIAVPAAE